VQFPVDVSKVVLDRLRTEEQGRRRLAPSNILRSIPAGPGGRPPCWARCCELLADLPRSAGRTGGTVTEKTDYVVVIEQDGDDWGACVPDLAPRSERTCCSSRRTDSSIKV